MVVGAYSATGELKAAFVAWHQNPVSCGLVMGEVPEEGVHKCLLLVSFLRELGNAQHLLGSLQSWILDSKGVHARKYSLF